MLQISRTSSETTAHEWKAQCKSIAVKLSAAAAAGASAGMPNDVNASSDRDADSLSGQLTALAEQVSFLPVLLVSSSSDCHARLQSGMPDAAAQLNDRTGGLEIRTDSLQLRATDCTG